jgi:mannose-6-phosphate isomerase-like protein (cupin superfamily)
VPCIGPPKPAAPPPVVVNPMAMDLLGFIEKNYIGREPGKTSPISCTPGGTASLIQVREMLDAPAHPDADHFLYVIAGAGAVRIGDRVEQLQSGAFTLIPRTTPHVLTAKGRSPLVILSIKAGEKCAVTVARGLETPRARRAVESH